MVRNTLTFKIVDKQEAFKDKVQQITLKPDRIGSARASDLDAFFARSYIIARREIPKKAEFMIYASCSGKADVAGGGVKEFDILLKNLVQRN